MSARVARIDAATAAGGATANQDRLFTTDNAVILLDGASSSHGQMYDGGWYADRLGNLLANSLRTDPTIGLTQAVGEAISAMADMPELAADPPSSTVAIARWNLNALDVLVLGDSPVVVFHRDGSITTTYDDRITTVGLAQRNRYKARLKEGEDYGDEHRGLLRTLREAERAARNTTDGYWIASTDPAASRHALARTYSLDEVAALLVASDGVSAAVTTYGRPSDWQHARHIIEQDGAEALIRLVHEVEAADPDGSRWPRSKAHDDKTVALIVFDKPEAAPQDPRHIQHHNMSD